MMRKAREIDEREREREREREIMDNDYIMSD